MLWIFRAIKWKLKTHSAFSRLIVFYICYCLYTNYKYCSNDIQILDRVVSVAIKAEFHTERNIKAKNDGDKNNGAYSSDNEDSNSDSQSPKELNYQEKTRLQELYEASRSLDCPLEQEKDVSIEKSSKRRLVWQILKHNIYWEMNYFYFLFPISASCVSNCWAK